MVSLATDANRPDQTAPSDASSPSTIPDEGTLRLRAYPEIMDAALSGVSWSGTIVGTVMRDAHGVWWVCDEVGESLPQVCSLGVVVAESSAAALGELEYTDIGSGGPLVRLTPTDVVVSGTFDPATMTFAVDEAEAR